MRIRANFLMRFLGQRRKLRLRQACILDMKLDSKAKTAAFARTDAYVGRDLGFRRVLLMLFRHAARPEQPDALQGFHASSLTISDDGRAIVAEEIDEKHRGQIMFVIEEAGGVHVKIFEVAEGALASPNASLLVGGIPSRSTGYFAASHRQNRADYTCLHFRSSDSPLVAPGYRQGLVRKFGEGSNVVRVRADGDFPRADTTRSPLRPISRAAQPAKLAASTCAAD